MKRTIPALLVLGIALLIGCKTLNPGTDPVVVRAEQSEQIALSTFDAVLNVDNAARSFWMTNAPEFHRFCEWLRAPQSVWVTNTLPRGAALVASLDDVRRSYKAGKADKGTLLGAVNALEAALAQARAWMLISTNKLLK